MREIANGAGPRRGSTTSARPHPAEPLVSAAPAVPDDLERLARWLDSSIRLPGGLRIGVDGLIGLIPGFGDVAGALLSLYVVGRASVLGLPRSVLARMVLNIAVDSVGGAVPVLGDLFDFAFKSNQRNIALLRRSMKDADRERRTSWLLLAGVGLLLVLLAALVVALGILLARLLAAAF